MQMSAIPFGTTIGRRSSELSTKVSAAARTGVPKSLAAFAFAWSSTRRAIWRTIGA
jgi:hypothetical protein